MVFAIAMAPYFPKAWLWWSLPIVSASPVIFWLWAQSAFDDDFILKRWHGVLWLTVLGFGFLVSLTWTTWPTLARAGGRALAFAALILALAAAAQTIRTWRADLVTRRRQLRVAVILMNVVLIVSSVGSDLLANRGAYDSLLTALGLFAVALLAGLGLFGAAIDSPVLAAIADETSGRADGGARAEIGAGDAHNPIAPMDRRSQAGTIRPRPTRRAGADDRHGRRIPVDRAVQSRVQGSHRRDADRISPRRPRQNADRCLAIG
jgi:hypothetical protein